MTLQEKIQLHKAFWANEPLPRPIYSISFDLVRMVAHKSKATENLLIYGKKITPDMLDVDLFVQEAVERFENRGKSPMNMYSSGERIPTIGVFGGIPWMEAIMGCELESMGVSIISRPCMEAPGDPDKMVVDFDNNPWVEKYFEFLRRYKEEFGAELPVSESLLRGISDTYGAIVGQEDMIYSLYDDPEIVKEACTRISDVYNEMVRRINSYTTKIEGGYIHPQGGFWCEGTPNMFQEDLTSLMTPAHYREYIFPLHERMTDVFGTNVMHTHPTSYHIFDELVKVHNLSALQMQMDVGETSLEHHYKAIAKVKEKGIPIFFSAPVTLGELKEMLSRIEPRGMAIHVYAKVPEEAPYMRDVFEDWVAGKIYQG